MSSNGFSAPPPAHVSTDYDPLPPPPPARPASAVGWAYDAPKQQGSAKVVAPPKARAMPVMVEEEADSEVAAVTSRMATATLPPSAALAHAASRQQAAAPPLAPAPAVKAAKAAVSYSFLVPPAPATAGDAPGASEASKLATQLARAEANESLYGDRACQALPTRAVRRGCLNPIVDCVAPGQRGGGGGMRGGDEDESDAGGRGGAGSRAGAVPAGSQGGIVASLSNSLSNLASYFGVGGSDDDPYAAAEEEAALADAARRAAAKQVSDNSSSAVAHHVGTARATSAADNAEESAMAFEAAWRERQRLREAGATRLEADAAVTGLDPVAMAASAPSPPPQQQYGGARMATPPSPQQVPPVSHSPDRMAAAGFAPQTASPARGGGFDPAASMVAARAAAVASAAEAAPPPPPTAPVPAPSAQDMFNAPMRSRLKSGSAAAAAAQMDADMARRIGGN